MIFIFSLVSFAWSLGYDSIGTIWPTGALPISNSITNALKISDYTFTFYTNHSLQANSNIIVTFPSQFISGLGISSCLSSLGSCIVSGTAVTVTLSNPLYQSKTYSLTIFGIQNPSLEGGTGNFMIQSFQGVNLIDSNSIFGVAGISQPAGTLISAGVNIMQGDKPNAGELARYEFKFKLYRSLGAWNWIRFTFPINAFQFDQNPTCTSFDINEFSIKGTLECSVSGTKVTIVGISQDIPAYVNAGIRISVKNPSYSVLTGTFAIETGKNSTFTVYDDIFGISGIPILPGDISKISLTPANSSVILATSKQVLYRLIFLLSNPIPQGGKIQIICTQSFTMNGIYYLEYGLDDQSNTQLVTIVYNSGSYTLTISSFAEFQPTFISILLFMINPSIAGVSDPLIIRTLLPDGVTIIDENTSDAFVTITAYTSPQTTSVTFPSGNYASGAAINLQLNFIPNFEVPANGWVQFTIPYNFIAISSTQTCYVKPTNELEQPAQSCYSSNGLVFIRLFSDSVGIYGKFEAGISSYVRITSLLSPVLSNTYLFDFSTFTSANVLIETGTATGTLIASILVPTISVIHAAINTPTIIQFQFTLSKALISGISLNSINDLIGGIEIALPTLTGISNLFAINLGLSSVSVPCLGISGITANLDCSITYSPIIPSTPVIVTISGFTAISSGTNVIIHFAGITYVNSANSPSITVTTYQIFNRVRYNLESGSAAAAIGIALPAITNLAVSLTLSVTTVLSSTVLSTGTPFTTTVASGAVTPYILIDIYITHDSGYCTDASITCTLDNIIYLCTCYPGADMILIYLTGSYTAGVHTMKISGLINPESVPSSNDNLLFYIIGNSAVKQYLSFAGKIPMLTAGNFLTSSIHPSNIGQGYVFVSYSILIQPINYIPIGGFIKISFPIEYALSSISPLPKCSSTYLHPISSSILCSLSSNTFTISGFQTVNASYIIVINIYGISNPLSSTSNFVISTLNAAGRIINQNSNLYISSLTNPWETQTINYLEISVFPSNANMTAEYSFTFTPSEYMGKGAEIQIGFPIQQFGLLPTTPRCRVSGEVNTFFSCVTSASNLNIITDQVLPYKPFTISLIGLLNFDQGSSQNFVITTSYANIILQTTGTGTNQLQAITTAQASILKVSSILFYPMNEGEEATYEFYFSPITNISSSQNIVVKFPMQFDYRVGDNIQCSATGLTGFLTCYLLNAYTIIVTENDPFNCPGCEIVLTLTGIINPAQGPTGQFLIGILDGSRYTEANEYSGFITVTAAANYSEIISTSVENLFSRYTQTITFKITCNKTIPTSANGGEIWINFPSDYLLSGSNIQCKSSSFFSGGIPICTTNSSKIIISGQTTEYNGTFFISVQGLPNPLTDVFAGFITVEVYDGFNRVILARSFPNLDPNRFQYVYPGPLITINNGTSFTVRRGTVSAFIPITLDYPCALNLTLAPTSGTFVFIPNGVLLHVGDVYAEFRVSIPYNTENTEYIILWEIIGDITPPFYTPILKSIFTVNKKTLMAIDIENIMPIPQGFSSLPVYVTLEAGPNSDLTVHLSLSGNVTGIQLSSAQLLFNASMYQLNFTIQVQSSVTVSSSKILLQISGTNAEAYTLSKTSVPFQIFLDSGAPEVLGAGAITSLRTSVLITVTTNKFCWVYYAYALRGTQPPSFEETKNRGPATYTTTHTVYGSFRVINSKNINLNITGLSASTRYTIYFWAEDLTQTQSTTYQQIDFETDVFFNTAEVELRFNQLYLNYAEIAKASSSVQLYLSLYNWRVLINTQGTLQIDKVKRFSSYAQLPCVKFYVIDDLFSSVYPTPLEMVSRLESLESKFEVGLNNFDTSYPINGSEIVLNECVFLKYPSIVDATTSYDAIGISASLVEDGYIYAIAVLASTDSGIPFSFQIFQGNDAWNRPTLSVFTNASAETNAFFSFSPVDQNTSYHIYIICTNNYPGYLQPAKDSYVQELFWTTDLAPQPEPFSIDNSILLIPIILFCLL